MKKMKRDVSMMRKKINLIILIILAIIFTLTSSFFAFYYVNENVKEPELRIALINEDQAVYFHKQAINFGAEIVKQVERDKTYVWSVLSRGTAEQTFENNENDIMITIPHDFSKKALGINEIKPEFMHFIYKINPAANFLQATQAQEVVQRLQNRFNKNVQEVYFASVLTSLNNTKENVKRMVEEEVFYENIMSEKFTKNMAEMNTNFNVLKEANFSDVESLDALSQSLENFNNNNIQSIETTQKYLGLYQEWENQWQQNHIDYTNYTLEYQKFSAQLEDVEHQDNLVKIDMKLSEMQVILEEKPKELLDIMAMLETANNNVTETIKGLNANNNALINLQGMLSREFNGLGVNQETAITKLDTALTETCKTLENQTSEQEIFLKAKAACEKLGLFQENLATKSYFYGTTKFLLQDNQSATIVLALDPLVEAKFMDICKTNEKMQQNVMQNTLTNDENTLLTCTPQQVTDREIKFTVATTDGGAQYLEIPFAVEAKHDMKEMLVAQTLITEDMTELTIDPVTVEQQVITGTGMPKTTVVLTQAGTTIGETVVAADGTWQILTEKQRLQIGQTLAITQKNMTQNSATATTQVVDTVEPTAAFFTTGKQVKIEGKGTPYATIQLSTPVGEKQTIKVMSNGKWATVVAQINATDELKLSQKTTTGKQTMERTLRPVRSIVPKVNEMLEAQTSLMLTGEAAPLSQVIFTLPDQQKLEVNADAQGYYQVNLPPLRYGASVSYEQRNVHGDYSIKQVLKVDDTKVPNKIESLKNHQQTTLYLTGIAEPEATVEIEVIDNQHRANYKVAANQHGIFVVQDADFKVSEKTEIMVKQKDAAGHESESYQGYLNDLPFENKSEQLGAKTLLNEYCQATSNCQRKELKLQPYVISEDAEARMFAGLFELYLGMSMEDYISSDLGGLEQVKTAIENSDIPNENALYYDLFLVRNPLNSFNDDLNEEFKAIIDKNSGILKILDGESCNPDGATDEFLNNCAGGIDEQIKQEIGSIQGQADALNGVLAILAGTQELQRTFMNDFEAIKAVNTQVKTSQEKLTEHLALEGELQVPVVGMHPQLLEKVIGTQETVQGYYQQLQAMTNQGSTLYQLSEEMKTSSDQYKKDLHQTTQSLQDKLEKNLKYHDNLQGVFTNSKVNGIENNDLYQFLANPVRQKIDQGEKTTQALFPYFMLILCFIIALLTAYVLLQKRKLPEIKYVDEYLLDIMKANGRAILFLSALGALIGFIIGVTSGYFAGLASIPLVKWIAYIVLLEMTLVVIMYALLRQFKSIGLFIIMGIFLVYLIANPSMGVYFSQGTTMAMFVNLFPLKYLEQGLYALLFDISSSPLVTIVCCLLIAFIMTSALSIVFGIMKGRKEVKKYEQAQISRI